MRLSVLAVLGMALSAQSIRFSPPVLGYVYDEGSRGIHAISGIAGAAALEPAFLTDYDQAFVHSARSYAFVRKDGAIALLRWGNTPGAIALPGAMGDVNKVAFSPSGDAAVLYGNGAAQIWRGLPSTPSLAREWSAPAAVDALAISDGGAVVAAVTEERALVVYAEGGERRLSGEYSSAAFLNASGDLVAVEPGASRLVLVRDAASEAHVSMIASADFAMAATAAVSADNKLAIVASRGWVSVIDIATGATANVACECAAGELERVAGNAVFRLTRSLKSGLTFLDAEAGEPRIFSISRGSEQ